MRYWKYWEMDMGQKLLALRSRLKCMEVDADAADVADAKVNAPKRMQKSAPLKQLLEERNRQRNLPTGHAVLSERIDSHLRQRRRR